MLFLFCVHFSPIFQHFQFSPSYLSCACVARLELLSSSSALEKTKQTSAEREIALPLYDISSHHNILELLSIK